MEHVDFRLSITGPHENGTYIALDSILKVSGTGKTQEEAFWSWSREVFTRFLKKWTWTRTPWSRR